MTELNERIIKALEAHAENTHELFHNHAESLGVGTEKNRRIAQGYHDEINEANYLISVINKDQTIKDSLEQHNDNLRGEHEST